MCFFGCVWLVFILVFVVVVIFNFGFWSLFCLFGILLGVLFVCLVIYHPAENIIISLKFIHN